MAQEKVNVPPAACSAANCACSCAITVFKLSIVVDVTFPLPAHQRGEWRQIRWGGV